MVNDYNAPARTADTKKLNEALVQLQPGDTVKAVFYDQHYRTFEITGVVVEATTDPGIFLLASWMLNMSVNTDASGNKDHGKPAKMLKELEILETASRTLF